MKARANLERGTAFKSGEEALWFAECPFEIDKLGLAVVATHYEPLKFYVGGGWYTPDFMHVLDDGRILFVEVKGSRFQPSYRAARVKLKAAAEKYAIFYWLQATREKGKSWDLEWIGPSPQRSGAASGIGEIRED